jgi:predicted branched-subunit amino acid permease
MVWSAGPDRLIDPEAPASFAPQGARERALARRSIVAATVPVAVAIAVFGMVYGAAASAEFGPELTVVTSLLVFSGTTQFATLGLVASGAGSLAIIVTVVALNTRHLVLGAALRPRVEGSRARRAILSWFLIDESFGLAMASTGRAGRVLLLAGATCYVAWLVGTVLGVVGARLVALEGMATAVFPVLFIGLAAITATGRHIVGRAIVAGVSVALLALAIPDATVHAFLPIVAAVIVALPETRSR